MSSWVLCGARRACNAKKQRGGECANDFRTFLMSEPELPCLELVSD